VDCNDRIQTIVLATQNTLGLSRLDLRLEPVKTGIEITGDILATGCPFGQHAEIVLLLLQGFEQVDTILQPPSALKGLLRLSLVLPEIGFGNPRFQPGDLIVRKGCLKDNSGDRGSACRVRRDGGSERPIRVPLGASLG
jgi:hypothetical protein